MIKRVLAGVSIVTLAALSVRAQPDTTRAHRLFTKGVELQERAAYDSANTQLIRASDNFGKDAYPIRFARCYNLVSSNYRQLEQFGDARFYARWVWNMDDGGSREMVRERILAAFNYGMSEASNARYDSALVWLNRGVQIADSISASARLRAKMLGAVGFVYDDQGYFDRAIDQYAQALRLLQRSGGDHPGELAKLYNNIGVAYSNKGEYQTALQFYKQELKINKQLRGKRHPDVAGSYNNIGAIYYRMGDIGEAVNYFKQALRIVKQSFGVNHPVAALLQNNIGESLSEMGDNRQALDYLKRAAEIKKERQGPRHPDVAYTYNAIAQTYVKMEMFDLALEYFEESLSIRRDALGDSHPFVATTLFKMGDYYIRTEQFDAAIDHLDQAIEITRKTRGRNHPNIVEGYRMQGVAYTGKDAFGRALSSYRHGLNLVLNDTTGGIQPDNTPFPLKTVEILFEKGKTLQQFARVDSSREWSQQALSTYHNATAMLDHIQFEYQSEESKLLISRLSHDIHEEAIKAAYSLYEETGSRHYADLGFYFSEKSRSRVMVEQLLDNKAKKFADIPDSLLHYEQSLRSRIASLHQRLETLPADSLAPVNSLQDSLFILDRQLFDFISLLERQYPRYHQLKYNTHTPTLTELQQTLEGSEEVILEYFIGNSSLFSFAVSNEQVRFNRHPYDSSFVDNIERFSRAVATSDTLNYLVSGATLYRNLLAPALPPGMPGGDLTIIPDGKLNLLPFEALLTSPIPEDETPTYETLPYLIRERGVSYMPSASIYTMIKKRDSGPDSNSLLAFAPSFQLSSSESNDGLRSVTGIDRELSPLLHTGQEVRKIASLFEEQEGFWVFGDNVRTTVYTDLNATESAFKREAIQQYRYIHLATHAFAFDDEEKQDGIVFAQTGTGGEDDFLSRNEIYNLSLNADLVTLSACETARGNLVRGEGIIGMVRAFQYAGGNNLLVSLWKVEDRSTARLMTDFYGRLLAGSDKRKALQDAKLSLVDHPTYANPRYWAPFILVGK